MCHRRQFSRQPLHYVAQGPRPRIRRRARQQLHCAAAFPRVPAASAGPQRVSKANGECLFLFQNSKFLGQFRVHTRARASILLTPPEGGVILSDDFWDHGESTCYTANSSREVVKTVLRAGLFLLRLEKGQKADSRDLNDLETNTGDITLGLTGATEAGDEDLVVLVDEVEAAVVGDEGGDLLAVLDELDTDALSDSRVGLLGLDADLLEDDALGLGRATGGGGLVEVAEGALLVGSVGPAVVSAGRDLLTGCVKSTGLAILKKLQGGEARETEKCWWLEQRIRERTGKVNRHDGLLRVRLCLWSICRALRTPVASLILVLTAKRALHLMILLWSLYRGETA